MHAPSPSTSEHAATRVSRRALLGVASALALELSTASTRAQPAPGKLARLVQPRLLELERWAATNQAKLGAAVLDGVDPGANGVALIAASSPHLPLNPASNQKILTLVVALEVLGPQHRFSTTLHGRGNANTLSELVLRSDGNPDFSTSDLAELVRRLSARGAQHVSGDIWVDQSAFDASWEPPAYEQRPDEWAAYRAPVSAVALDRNAITLHVLATSDGAKARVWCEPPGLVEITGSVLTGPVTSARNVRLSMLRGDNDRLRVSVGGSVPAGAPELSFSRRLHSPATAAGSTLHALLRRAGIRVDGRVRSGGSGIVAPLARIDSPPLSQLAPAAGKRSDNFHAEMFLKAVGAKASGAEGSSAAGARVIHDYMTALGALDPGTRVSNGSGLYDANRVSAFGLARVLSAAANNPRVAPDLVASLAIGGLDGTLAHRFAGLSAARTVRAKTGTLAQVVALSGYVLRKNAAAPVSFAILLNDVKQNHAQARQRIDAIVEAIAAAG